MKPSTGPCATPVAFSGCSGWLHLPVREQNNVAVLLCPAAGQDYTNGYRPFRILAEALAQAGYPVLRFDYPATGDSADEYGAELWHAWRQSVTDAADWLRCASGAQGLVLIGLRIGAVLAAAEAARREDVAGLVLIEPFFRAGSFVSLLSTESRLRSQTRRKPDPEQGTAPYLQVGELQFSRTDVTAMQALNISQLAFNTAPQVAVFSRDGAAKLADRLDAWQRQGIELSAFALEPLEPLLRPNRYSGEAELDAAELLGWMQQKVPAERVPAAPAPLPSGLQSDGWQEKIIRFGQKDLTGMLCQPSHGNGLTVLICNSGGNPRHGFARFGVVLARQLAEAGIASFRFDFAGLGDSIHRQAGADVQSDVFQQDRTEDFAVAIDALEALGLRRFAVHGLCSGAFHAVQAAFADRRVEAVTAINLPWFSLQREAPGPESLPRRYMRHFQERGMRVLLMFTAGDSGLAQFEAHFGQAGCDLAGASGITTMISGDFDHELTERWMQEIAVQETLRFLQRPAPLAVAVSLAEFAT